MLRENFFNRLESIYRATSFPKVSLVAKSLSDNALDLNLIGYEVAGLVGAGGQASRETPRPISYLAYRIFLIFQPNLPGIERLIADQIRTAPKLPFSPFLEHQDCLS